MADEDFDTEAAIKFLRERERSEKNEREEERQKVLHKVTLVLKEKFADSGVDVYLIGSILEPFGFSPHSDIDIVVKNFHGDRFDLWTALEHQCGRTVEIILFESCSFADHVVKYGLKVV
jgi:predicted nucleotidyltransferase